MGVMRYGKQRRTELLVLLDVINGESSYTMVSNQAWLFKSASAK
jgi:hypothetical protein